MFYFHEKKPKSHIEKIHYFHIAVVLLCESSTIDMDK